MPAFKIGRRVKLVTGEPLGVVLGYFDEGEGGLPRVVVRLDKPVRLGERWSLTTVALNMKNVIQA